MAAKQLSKGRSTVTEHIEAFEDRLGQALFTKQGREMELSSFGKEIYHHSVLLYKQISAWDEMIQRATEQKNKAPIRIAYTDVLPKQLLLKVMKNLQQKEVSLELIETGQHMAISMLSQKQVDLVVGPTITVANEQDFESEWRLIGSMPFRFYAHKDYFSEQPVNITDLVSHTQLLPRAYANKFRDEQLIFTTNNLSITDIELLKEALEQQIGWAFLPKHLHAEQWQDITEVITELGREGFITPIEARWRNGECSVVVEALDAITHCIAMEGQNWLIEKPYSSNLV